MQDQSHLPPADHGKMEPVKLKNGLRQRRQEPVLKNGGHTHSISSDSRKSSWPRIFRVQPSLNDILTATDKSFQVVRDVAMVQITLFIAYILIRDSFVRGRDMLDLSWFYSALGPPASILKALTVELSLLCLALFVQPCFKVWQYLRVRVLGLRPLLDVTFLLMFASYVFGTAAYVCWMSYNIPFSTYATAILTIEQLRLSMKTYSFVRENAYKVVYPWSKGEQKGPALWYDGQLEPTVGSFRQFVFFLFAPTLLYRDNYPRNPGPINWRNVFIYFIQFVMSMWCITILMKEFIFPSSFKSDVLVLSYVASLVCVLPITILGHTCVLHSYLNFFCELFRFADREFYGDWWTSTSFSVFYRKWNMLVHDWLHSYVYRDMKNVTGNQWLAVFATIHLSAVIHEYIVAIALRFACPLLFIEFAIGGAFVYFVQPKSMQRLSNILLLIGYGFGAANLIFHYQVEFAARLYCPKQMTLWNFFMPQAYDCYYTTNNNITSALY